MEIAVAIVSALAAVVATAIAVNESRAKAKKAEEHAAETRKYAAALDTVIKAGQYLKYLQGADAHIGEVAKHLEELTRRSKEVADLASEELQRSVSHLRSLTESAEKVAHDLRQISAITLRAQRDRLRAHRDLLSEQKLSDEIGPKKKDPTDEEPDKPS